MPPAFDLDRFRKLCGMLGSEHEGERHAAALKATQMLRDAGYTWQDVWVGAAVDLGHSDTTATWTPPSAASSPPWGDRAQRGYTDEWANKVARAILEVVERGIARMNPNQMRFLSEMKERWRPPTERQAEWLLALAEKAGLDVDMLRRW